MSSDETESEQDRQTPQGDDQESHGVRDDWELQYTAINEDDAIQGQNENHAMSLVRDNERRNDIIPKNGSSQLKSHDFSSKKEDSGQNDIDSSQGDSRWQDDTGSWIDNDGIQNDIVPENDDNIGQDRAVSLDNVREQVSQLQLNAYGATQNDTTSGCVDIAGRNDAIHIYKDRQGQICLTPLENKDTARLGDVNNIDSDIAVPEVDSNSELYQTVPLDDNNIPDDGAVAWYNNEMEHIAHNNFAERNPENTLTPMTADRSSSYIGHVIHIRSLALDYFTLSETVEVWAWPLPDEG